MGARKQASRFSRFLIEARCGHPLAPPVALLRAQMRPGCQPASSSFALLPGRPSMCLLPLDCISLLRLAAILQGTALAHALFIRMVKPLRCPAAIFALPLAPPALLRCALGAAPAPYHALCPRACRWCPAAPAAAGAPRRPTLLPMTAPAFRRRAPPPPTAAAALRCPHRPPLKPLSRSSASTAYRHLPLPSTLPVGAGAGTGRSHCPQRSRRPR